MNLQTHIVSKDLGQPGSASIVGDHGQTSDTPNVLGQGIIAAGVIGLSVAAHAQTVQDEAGFFNFSVATFSEDRSVILSPRLLFERVSEELLIVQRYFSLVRQDAIFQYLITNPDLLDVLIKVGVDIKRENIWSSATVELVEDPEESMEAMFIDLKLDQVHAGRIDEVEDELWESHFSKNSRLLRGRVVLSVN